MNAVHASPVAEVYRAQSVVSRAALLHSDTAGELIYAIGDIHGRYDLMVELLAFLAEDARARARSRRPMLVFTGDYIDRGPESARVVEALTLVQRRAEVNVHLLKGNHEQALLAFLENPQNGAMWLRCGGVETLISYGVDPPSPDGAPQELAG
ncbi:metallophosphoesterase, partial [Phenylobacterium sp.]|uniref:metallophosphoesterase n=1 Tax=Phenylobacterium sp. TaxID=1871053 RepID=UPI00286D8508